MRRHVAELVPRGGRVPNVPTLAAGLLDREAPYLAFAVRSDIGVQPELLPRFEAMLAEHERAPSLRFVTPLEALAALRRGIESRS